MEVGEGWGWGGWREGGREGGGRGLKRVEGGKGVRWAETAARDEVLDYKRGRGCEDTFL